MRNHNRNFNIKLRQLEAKLLAYFGHKVRMLVNEYIYNSFVIVTLGSLGIAGLEKFAGKKSNQENTDK